MKPPMFFVSLISLLVVISVVPNGASKETSLFHQFVKPPTPKSCHFSTHKPTTQTAIFDKFKADLENLVKKYEAQSLLNVGIMIVDQASKQSVEINPNQVFETASLYKLFVLWKLQVEINAGLLTDSTEIPVVEYTDESNLIVNSTYVITVAEARWAMITYSDNTAAWSLATALGWQQIDDLLIAHNFAFTHINQDAPTTNAREITCFFESIYNQNLDTNLKKADYELMLDLLKKQTVNIYLPQGFPANTVFAHKTGTLDGFNHDAGILYSPAGNVFFVTVLTEGDSSSFMKELAELTWQTLLKTQPHSTSRNSVSF